MDADGLKLPSDAEESDESGPGLDDYDDEEDFGKGIVDDSEDDEGSKGEQNGKDGGDNEADLDDVFALANENQEMDMVENLRRQADEAANAGKPAEKGSYINADLVGKIEQIEDEMMNPKSW